MLIVITTSWWSSTILNSKNTMILLNFVQRGNLRCFCCCHSCRHLASSQYLMTVIIWCRSSSISYDYFIEVIECFAIFFTLFVKDMYTSDYACFTLTLSFQHHVCVLWRDSWCHYNLDGKTAEAASQPLESKSDILQLQYFVQFLLRTKAEICEKGTSQPAIMTMKMILLMLFIMMMLLLMIMMFLQRTNAEIWQKASQQLALQLLPLQSMNTLGSNVSNRKFLKTF